MDHFWREEQLFLLRWNNSRELGSLRKRHIDSTKRGKKKSCCVEENMSAHFPQERKDEADFLKCISKVDGEMRQSVRALA